LGLDVYDRRMVFTSIDTPRGLFYIVPFFGLGLGWYTIVYLLTLKENIHCTMFLVEKKHVMILWSG
jgi:hypothetical protein